MTVFVTIDTNTSSTLRNGRVIEVGTVQLELENQDGSLQSEILDEWSVLVNPGTAPITPAALQNHKLTKRNLKNEALFDDLAEEITTKLDGDVLVFHGSNLDSNRLASEYAKLGTPVPRGENQIVDTSKLAEGLGLPSEIDELIKELGIDGETNRALPAAQVIAEILTCLVRDRGVELDSLLQPRAKLTALELQIISVEREEAWAAAVGREMPASQAQYLSELRQRQAEVS